MAVAITIYTDGAAKGNPGPGGYGLIMQSGEHYKEFSQGFRLTTNNRMELTAVIEALQCTSAKQVSIYTDSQWVINCAQRLWKRNKNMDLWQQFESVAKYFSCIEYIWVKGHSGDLYNERCDKLAYNEVIKKKQYQ